MWHLLLSIYEPARAVITYVEPIEVKKGGGIGGIRGLIRMICMFMYPENGSCECRFQP